MKNVFDGYINSLHTAKERITELQDMSTETFKTATQRAKRLGMGLGNQTEYPRTMYLYKSVTCLMGIP